MLPAQRNFPAHRKFKPPFSPNGTPLPPGAGVNRDDNSRKLHCLPEMLPFAVSNCARDPHAGMSGKSSLPIGAGQHRFEFDNQAA
jgi:hypothetical protein